MPTILSTLSNLAPGDPDTQWGSMTRLAPLVPYLILLSLIARLGHPSRASDASDTAAATNSRAVYHQASKDNDGALKADIRKLMAENERLLAQVAVNRGTSKGLLRALERSRTINLASRRRTTHAISKIASLKAAYRSSSGKLSHTIPYDADCDANLCRLREKNGVLRSDLDTSRAREVDLQARLDERDGLLQEALEGRYDLHLQRAEALSRAHELEKELAKVKDKLDQVVQRCEDQEVLVADQEALIADHEVVIADLSTQVKDMKARDDAHRDSVNAKLEAELEAVKTELATVTWERDDFETALEEVLEVTTTANEVVDEATLKLEELDSATATLKERHSQEVARLRADITLKESAIVDLKETVASLSRQSSPAPQVSQSTTPPTSPTTLAHQLPTPEMPDLIRDDDNDSSSDSDSPPTTPVLDAAPFAEPAYSLPSPPPVEFNDEDDGELPITPFPRRLAPLRSTTYCPRPMLRAGILIRQAMVTCKQAVPALPEAEMDAVACLEWIASEPPPPASPRAYRLRDEREFEVVGCWIPRPVEVEDAPLPLRDRRPLGYGPHSRRGVNRLGGSRIPVACYT